MRFLAILLAILYIYIPHFVFAESIIASQSITSDWGIGFCGNISLKNTGTTEASWSELTFVLSNATVTSLWGGNVSHIDNAYTVKSLSWNQKIAPGSSTDVGYCGQGAGRPTSLNLTASTTSTLTPPPSLVERPSVVTLNASGLSLVASVTGDWNSGYCRNVVLKNTGTTPITNWNISFDMIGDINIWSATKVKNGNTITVTPASWNAKLGQAEWGFCTTGSQVDQNWQIVGVETGVAPPLPDSINGICGSDNNATLSSTPTNLCISGTSSALSGTGPWSWTCQGLNSGTTMSCQASKGTVTSPPPPSSPIVISGSIVIGYYPSWARYSFTYDKIDYSKFDIINHAFVFPSATTGIKIDADFLYPELVSSVHAHGKKILVTVGNVWGDPIFNTVMSDPAKRQLFISALKKVVIDNNYDGVDVDWEFPADAREGRLFLDLIRDLKIALPGKLVTVAISVLPHDFDLATLSSYADYINIMTYDMEAWYNYAGYNAPLYRNSKMPIDSSIDHYIRTTFSQPGIDPKKLILGVPLYGRKFATQNPYEPAYQSVAVEYKDLPKDCTRKWDSESLVPYLSCAGFYISYDDAESVRYKQEYANTMKLGGIFFWALGQDKGAIISQIVPPPSVTPVVTASDMLVSTTIAPTAKKSKVPPSTLSSQKKTTTARTIRTLRRKVSTKR